MKRAVSIIAALLLGLLLVLSVALTWLVSTTSGAQWLADVAGDFEPRLGLSVTRGSLWRGLDVSELRWQDEDVELHIRRVQVRWEPLCVLRGQLCVDELRAEHARLRIRGNGGAEPDGESAEFDLPLAVQLGRVQLDDFAVETPDVRLAWERLRGGGSFDNELLRLTPTHLLGLDVSLRETQAAAAEAAEPGEPLALDLPFAVELEELNLERARLARGAEQVELGSLALRAQLRERELRLERVHLADLNIVMPEAAAAQVPDEPAEAITLAEVSSALTARVDDFRLERARLERGEQVFELKALALAAALRESRLQLTRLELEHPQGQAQLRGDIELHGDYPLSLDVDAQLSEALVGQPQRVQARLRENLADLAIDARLSGGVAAELSGRLEPLRPSLPFSFRGRWNELGWPLPEHDQIVSRQGRVEAVGDLERYRLTLETELDGAEVPAARLSVRAHGDFQSLLVDRLRVATLDGVLSARGRVEWADGLRWDVQAELDGLDPGVQWPQYSGDISGRVVSHGALADEEWTARVVTEDLRGRLRGVPLALQARIEKKEADHWAIERLRLVSEDNRLLVVGSITDSWDLRARFELERLNALLPELSGSLAGRLRLQGPLTEPDVGLEVRGSTLAWEDTAELAQLDIQGRIARLGGAQSEVRLALAGLTFGEQSISEVSAVLEGDLQEHRLRFTAREQDNSVLLRLGGSLSEREPLAWAGRLLEGSIEAGPQHWDLERAVSMRYSGERQQLELAAHCWGFRDARLCLDEDGVFGAQGLAAISVRDYRLEWLAEWLPPGVFWRAPLDADARLRWGGGDTPRLRLKARSAEGEVLLSQEGEAALNLDYQLLQLAAELDEDGLKTSLELDSEQLGSGALSLQALPDNDQYQLQGEASLQGLRLALAKPFLPRLRTLRGLLGAQGRIGGTLQDPRFYGEINLSDGAVAAPDLPMDLEQINLTLAIDGTAAELDGGFRSGEGEARVRGQGQWAGEEDWRLGIQVEGERLRAVYPPIVQVEVSPDLQVLVRPGRVELSGQVLVPRGRLTLQELPPQAVPVSDDVIIVRRPGDPDDAEPQPEPGAIPGWSIVSDIQVRLGRDVVLSGYGVQGLLRGELRLRQEEEVAPEAFGELRVEEGRYEAYGQRLSIRQGQLIFAGPIGEPTLNIEAVREINGVVAGIRISGRPEEPEAALFSDPVMPQEDILSYIIRGRPLAEAGPGGQAALAQLGLALGAMGGAGLVEGVAEDLGVEDFAIDVAGEGAEAQFVISGYLGPNLYLQYGVGVFEPVNQLTARYHFHPRFHVEVLSGLENALDLFYTFEF